MATTGRWFQATMHNGRIGHRLTMMERIQRWWRLRKRREEYPDVYMVTGFYPPVHIRR